MMYCENVKCLENITFGVMTKQYITKINLMKILFMVHFSIFIQLLNGFNLIKNYF